MEQTITQSKEINILDLVMTTNEASQRYSVADCTFRTWIKDGVFDEEDIKKSGSTWIIKLEAIESVLKKKNMLGKTFELDGEKVHVEHLGYKGKKIRIWYENDLVMNIIENMPQSELIHQMFEVYKEDTKMNYKDVIIEGDIGNSENWFFRKEKVWALTLKSVLETLRQSMKMKEFDTTQFDSYFKNLNIELQE